MSSKKAIYESSMLCGFGADGWAPDSNLPIVTGADEGRGAVLTLVWGGFGFAF